MINEFPQVSLYEINKEYYLNKFPREDVVNLMHLTNNILRELTKQSKRSVIMAVGGTINKPLPRKDIDLIILLGRDRDSGLTPYKETCQNYLALQRIIQGAIADGYFRVTEQIPPAIDEEFGSESILKFTGVMIIQAVSGGTPIEIINEQAGLDSFRTEETSPFVVLAESK
jgi:hypothetical protein